MDWLARIQGGGKAKLKPAPVYPIGNPASSRVPPEQQGSPTSTDSVLAMATSCSLEGPATLKLKILT
jgi:hypothetical protein